MKTGAYFQCTKCGQIHQIEMSYNIDSDLYIDLYCGQCDAETKQLWVGENPEDKFIYMDINVEPLYFL